MERIFTPFVAPWLRPVDTLGAIQAGSHAGLQLRSQDQQAEAQAIAQQLAQQRALASQQEAADRLRYSYDALAATQEQRRRAEALKREEDAASRMLHKSDFDSLQTYRMKRLENDAAKIAAQRATPNGQRIMHVGDELWTVDPTSNSAVKTPGFVANPKAPNVSHVPLDPNPGFGKVSPTITLPATDPRLNVIAGTNNWGNLVGTNFNKVNLLDKPSDSIPKVTNQSEYDALPKGSKYIAPDGSVLTKKK